VVETRIPLEKLREMLLPAPDAGTTLVDLQAAGFYLDAVWVLRRRGGGAPAEPLITVL